MCWISDKAIKQIAEEDIPTIKVVRLFEDGFISLYLDFKYELDKVYETELGEVKEREYHYVINEGFHSYDLKCTVNIHRPLTDRFFFMRVSAEDGTVLDTFMHTEGMYLIEIRCIIPKGAEYYLNNYGEYVSNQIKIIGEVPIVPVSTKRY